MNGVRRSGRIAKEVPILLLGTDTSGKVFSEHTKTVVLSRHGAGIVSRYVFAPEESLTIRLEDDTQDAEVRLVGKMGDSLLGHIYGVEFRDEKVNFWGMDFPGPEEFGAPALVALECSICHEEENVQQTEIESDVYLITEGIFRQCPTCGQTTRWKRATGEKRRIEAAKKAQASAEKRDDERKMVTLNGSSVAEPAGPGATQVAATELPAAKTAVLEEPAAATKRENRRKHVRTRVNFAACVRVLGHGDEVVECENASRGGLCFRSTRRYVEGTQIELAAPYSPGEMAIFVTAVIKRREEIAGGKSYRYGVAYEKSSRGW